MFRSSVPGRRWLYVSTLLVSILIAGACSDTNSDSAAPTGKALVLDGEEIASAELIDAARTEGNLVVYSVISEDPQLALLEAFEADTGIQTELVRVPTARMLERVKTEFGADRISGDVLCISDVSYVTELVELGVFQPHRVAAWDQIEEAYKDAEARYYSWTLAPTAIGVNTAVIPDGDRPREYADLLNPALRGQIGLISMDVGTTPWGIAMFMRDKYGKEFWEKFAAQDPILMPGSAQVADQLGRGEFGVGISRPNVILAQKDQGAPVEMVWPEDGVPVLPFFLGVLTGSPHTKAAQVYLNWSMSKRGQQAAGRESGEYPVRSDVDPPQMLGTTFPRLTEIAAYFPDEQTWVNERQAWTQEWNDIFGGGQ